MTPAGAGLGPVRRSSSRRHLLRATPSGTPDEVESATACALSGCPRRPLCRRPRRPSTRCRPAPAPLAERYGTWRRPRLCRLTASATPSPAGRGLPGLHRRALRSARGRARRVRARPDQPWSGLSNHLLRAAFRCSRAATNVDLGSAALERPTPGPPVARRGSLPRPPPGAQAASEVKARGTAGPPGGDDLPRSASPQCLLAEGLSRPGPRRCWWGAARSPSRGRAPAPAGIPARSPRPVARVGEAGGAVARLAGGGNAAPWRRPRGRRRPRRDATPALERWSVAAQPGPRRRCRSDGPHGACTSPAQRGPALCRESGSAATPPASERLPLRAPDAGPAPGPRRGPTWLAGWDPASPAGPSRRAGPTIGAMSRNAPARSPRCSCLNRSPAPSEKSAARAQNIP